MSEIISSLLEYFFATSESIFEISQRYKFYFETPSRECKYNIPMPLNFLGKKINEGDRGIKRNLEDARGNLEELGGCLEELRGC